MGAKDKLLVYMMKFSLGQILLIMEKKKTFSQFKFVSRGGFYLFILHYLTYQTRKVM